MYCIEWRQSIINKIQWIKSLENNTETNGEIYWNNNGEIGTIMEKFIDGAME